MPTWTVTLLQPEKKYPQGVVDYVENFCAEAGLGLSRQEISTDVMPHTIRSMQWLMEGEDGDVGRLYDVVHGSDMEADIIIRPADSPPIRLLISDMDATMIQQECIDEMAAMLGIKEEVAAITEAAMRGELVFEAALEARVKLLEGLPEAKLQEVYETRLRFSPGARELVQGMRARGVHCVLVSGGFDFFTGRVAGALDFDAHHANRLEVASGRLTGRVIPPILGQQAKLDRLRQLCAEGGFGPESVLAIGDGANDLPMLEAAGLGVAYRGKPQVLARIPAQLHHVGLEGLLAV